MTYKEHVEYLQRRLDNPVKGIPINLPTIQKYYPFIEKEHRILLTADTGNNKTQFVNQFFLLEPLEYAKVNSNIKIDIYYFSIELTSNVVLSRMYNYYLGKKGKIYKIPELSNPSKEETLLDIKSLEPEFLELEKHLHIIDNLHNGQAIFKFMQKEMLKYGTLEKDASGGYVFKYFDENQYILVVVDTIDALQDDPDPNLDQTKSIRKWSEVYQKLFLSNIYRCCIVDVQQQDNDVRKAAFTSNSGSRIEDKHEPSLGGMATVKTSPKDHTLVLSMFKPHRYKITSHEGYPISLLEDHYIKLNIMKSSFGEMGPEISTHLYCEANRGYFEELPASSDKVLLEDFMKEKGIFKLKVNATKDKYLI